MRLILASASPRRSELLRMAGIAFDVDPADVDETPIDGEDAAQYAQRIAREKAAVVSARHPSRFVLAADTTVVLDGRIYGKPSDRADALRMLETLSGRSHEVLTAVALAHPAGTARPRAISEHLERTVVTFSSMTPAEMDWYVASGEADGKAGAYAIQGLASRFIPRIEGSYTNVVGLPVAAVHRMLEAALSR